MPNPAFTVGIYTLGCKVNQYESEAIAEAFASVGCRILPPTDVCDVYVINTCTVTAESDRKARQFIRRAIHQNEKAFILVTGCFAQVSAHDIAAIDGVDYICGNAEKLSVVDAALALIKKGAKPASPQILLSAPDEKGFEAMQIKRFERTRAYVKIEDGCESHCTYCIIPAARGKIRSKKPLEVLDEVRKLTDGGCREIVLTGIETASYGKDIGYTLADLLCEIDKIPNIGRIRLGSLDPSIMRQEFVDRIANLKSLAPHFHLSIQSGSDHILALMKRKYNTKIAREGVARLRKAIPNVQFTTDIIVGFPGETEEDFLQTVAFAKEVGFLMIHAFPYSPRQGTPAAAMKERIPQPIKHKRVIALTDEAKKIRSACLDQKIGQVEEILVEGYKNGHAHGHTADFCEVSVPMERPPITPFLSVQIQSHNGTLCFAKLLYTPQQKGTP